MKKEYIFKGGSKSKITIDNDKLIISRKGMLNFLNQGLKGDKTIFIKNISSIQLKKNGFNNGYIQFSLIGGGESKGGILAATQDENTVMLGRKGEYEQALEIKEYIESQQMIEKKTSTISAADEIKKFKELLDLGVITQDEFNAMKKEILGL